MKVMISLPYELRLVGNEGVMKIFLEFPRTVKIVRVEDSWKYYSKRGIWFNNKRYDLLKPIKLVLRFSVLESEYRGCKGLRGFLEERSDVVCKGVTINTNDILDFKGMLIRTRIDLIGPRLRPL